MGMEKCWHKKSPRKRAYINRVFCNLRACTTVTSVVKCYYSIIIFTALTLPPLKIILQDRLLLIIAPKPF